MSQSDHVLLQRRAAWSMEPERREEFGAGRNEHQPGVTLGVVTALVVWFMLVFLLAADDLFVRSPGTPPIPILIGFTAPIVIFLFLFSAWPAFRDYVLSIDLVLMTGIQAWRFAGFGFLALYAHGILPGLFAWSAGLGDIAIALAAPWIASKIRREPDFAASRTFVVWNLLGILDLVVAVGTGALGAALGLGVTTAPMARLPLVLIPTYFVPLFIMLHVTALYQSRGVPAPYQRKWENSTGGLL